MTETHHERYKSAAAAQIADQSTRILVGRLWRDHVRKYVGRLALAVCCMMVVAASTAAVASIMKTVVDDIFVDRNRSMLIVVAAMIFLIFFVKGLAIFAQSTLMTYVGHRTIADIQVRVFDHLMGSDLAYFQANHTGQLISRLTNDVNRLRAASSNVLVGVGKDLLTMALLTGVMFTRDWILALFACLVFPVASLLIVWIGRRVRGVTNSSQVQWGNLTSLLDEIFSGVRHVKAYGMEHYESDRTAKTVKKIYRLNFKSGMVRAAVHPIMGALTGLAVLLVVLYGGWQVIEGNRTAGELISFITALLLAYEPLKRLSGLNANLQEGLSAMQRLYAVLDTEPEVIDREGARPLVDDGRGDIAFDHVTFCYKRGQPAVQDVNLVLHAGMTVALVGPSGGGKSTLLNLIPRFFDVDSGAVRINGTDVRDVTLESLRANIALVSQEICLFNDTVAANIAYGSPDADITDIRRAAEMAAAAEFIEDLPDGYDTLLGERGLTLSGGQRQRIAIARALLKNAPILLLDEATSSLDSESERQVQAGLEHLMEGRTTLVIAHRLSTITNADKICYLEEGRIVETGTHGELLARGGRYSRLYTLQFEREAPVSMEAQAGQ